MIDFDQELKEAFALASKKYNYSWLSEEQAQRPYKATKKGYMMVPLDRDTFEEMRDASVFTGHWKTQTRQVMKKERKYRVNLYMPIEGRKEVEHRVAQLEDCASVHDLWGAIREMANHIMSDPKNKNAPYIQSKCRAVVKV